MTTDFVSWVDAAVTSLQIGINPGFSTFEEESKYNQKRITELTSQRDANQDIIDAYVFEGDPETDNKARFYLENVVAIVLNASCGGGGLPLELVAVVDGTIGKSVTLQEPLDESQAIMNLVYVVRKANNISTDWVVGKITADVILKSVGVLYQASGFKWPEDTIIRPDTLSVKYRNIDLFKELKAF